jgi:hypothetical protein
MRGCEMRGAGVRRALESSAGVRVTIHRVIGAALLLGVSVVAAPASAQSLAQRVRGVGTGVAELHYTTRPGVCGDGRRSFSIGSRFHIGEWYGDDARGRVPACIAGPARVRLRVEQGTITELQVAVGPELSHEERATELGAVASPEAAAFFLALAEGGASGVGRRAITAAVLADSTSVWQRLLAIAMDTSRVPRSTRKEAIFWVGRFAAAKLSGNGEDLAAMDDDADDGDDARSAAVFALSQLRGHEGVVPLLQVARTNRDPAVRRKALFWLGESGDPRAIALFREILRGG